MKTRFLKTAILITSVLFATTVFGQQVPNNKFIINDLKKNNSKVNVYNGSVYANFSDQKVTSEEIVNLLNKLLKLDENHTFEQISQRDDEIGFLHTNYQEFYKGYPVDGYIIMLHEKDGFLQSINGNAAKLKEIDVQINISDNQAINIAMDTLGVKKLFKEHPVQTVFAKNLKDNQFYLTKKVRIESFSPLMRYDVFVDAKTGDIMKKVSLLHNIDVQGTAQTLFKGTQTITCDKLSENSYQLYDNARNIGTYNGTTWLNFHSEPELYKNISANWSNNPALDVHWGMEKTYDYFLTTFQRNSYDGNGGEIFNIYDPILLYEEEEYMQYNAAAWGDGLMLYGRGGSDYGYNPFVSLDCAGHEFTHMVTDENGNGGLRYEGESGALNESFSDIFGTCIEFFANINPNWTIGEDIVVGGIMRSMSNPNLSGGYRAQPDTYLGDHWANTNSNDDNGGVHTNSGVQNFWFYLLCQGGSGTNDFGNSYSVSPVGMADAQKIAYRNLMNYIAPNANYVDAYNGSLQAAADLFGNPSTEYTAVKQAWYAVGIDETTVSPTSSCQYPTYFTQPSGTFDDGSGSENYKDNQECWWAIAPPCASSITLSFSELQTENGYDYVNVFDINGNLLAEYSGNYSHNNMPPPVTTNTGMMYVVLNSDEYFNYQGFTAHYTSTADDNCECETVLTDTVGTISDGSGIDNYNDDMQCVWHIAPPGAKNITLTFTEFITEYGYDIVEVRDDVNNTSKQFSGKFIPAPVTILSGEMTVIFITDAHVTENGWTADYTSSTKDCVPNIVLTDANGTISDGSGIDDYKDNVNCEWRIAPPGARKITLTFTEFDTEYEVDYVYVIDEVNETTMSFSGNSIPASVTIPSGKMKIMFITNDSITAAGWTANYTSTTTGLSEVKEDKIIIFPNPANNILNIQFAENIQNAIIEIYDVVGKLVMRHLERNIEANSTQFLNINNIPSGIYNIIITSDTKRTNHKLLISR